MKKLIFKRMMLSIIIGFPAFVPFILLFTGSANQLPYHFTSSLVVAYPVMFVLFWLLDYSKWLRRIWLLITIALGAQSVLKYHTLSTRTEDMFGIFSSMLKPAALSLYIVLALVSFIGFRLYKASIELMPQHEKDNQ